MPESFEDLTTREMIRVLKTSASLNTLELQLLDRLDMAMEEVDLLAQEIRQLRAAQEPLS